MVDNSELPNDFNSGRRKVNELKAVDKSFFEKPKTMKEADRDTGIMRESICWYCRTLRKMNRLYVIGTKYCDVTNHKANIYTTNPDLRPPTSQMSLF